MEMNIRMYWGIKNADRCSALPVPEYTCVKYTCVVAVGKHEKKLAHVNDKRRFPSLSMTEQS